MTDPDETFYEEDEPVEKVLAAYERGIKGVTAPVPDCRCPSCTCEREPGTDMALYSGPDAVTLMCEAAVRDGRYEDITALFDQLAADAHLALNAAARKARRTLLPAIRAVGLARVAAAERAAG